MSQRRRKFRPGSVISGTNYRVLRFLGSGAMGAVYEVMHGHLDKIFVIKVLHHDLVELEDPVRRLRRECRLLGRLQHPNIVSVTDAGMTQDGIPYFVMERLEGETLYSRMGREPRWSTREAVHLALQVLDGLVAAQEMGVVHRDIKPSNIFMSQDSGVKLLDFGIAKMFGSNATVTARGVTLGTPRYMSPEQASGNVAVFQSDLYALGIILYELIAGCHPFEQAQTPAEMLIAQAAWEAPLLPIDRVGRAKDLVALVARLLSKKPADRPSSAVSVRDCLRKIAMQLADAPVGIERSSSTKLPNAWQRLGRRRGSLRWVVALLAILAIGASCLATLTPMRRGFSCMRRTAIGSSTSSFADASSRPQSRGGDASRQSLLPVSSATPEEIMQPVRGMTLNETDIQPVSAHNLVAAVQSAKPDRKVMGAAEAEAKSAPRSLPIGSASIPSNGINPSRGSADAEFVNLTRR